MDDVVYETVPVEDLSWNIMISEINYGLTPLARVINCSLVIVMVLGNMKIARLSPILKSDDKTDMSQLSPYLSIVFFRNA